MDASSASTGRASSRPYPPHVRSDPYRTKAAFYDALVEPLQAGVRKVGLRLLPPDPQWEVLDVGCGTGTGLAHYLEAGCAVHGVDVSPAMLDRARERLGEDADLRLTDGDALPFDDDAFDLVMASMMIHEVSGAERVKLLVEMARVTKPDGRMLLIDDRFGSLRGWKGPVLRVTTDLIERLSGHYSEYRAFKAARGIPPLLEEAGLDLEREKIVAGGNIGLYVVRQG